MRPDEVAQAVHAQYARLSKTGKPQEGQWTIVAGIVMSRTNAEPRVVALGTGTKCLTAPQVTADHAGECLHDCHAEVIARRALRHFFTDEVHMLGNGGESEVFELASDGEAFRQAAHRRGIPLLHVRAPMWRRSDFHSTYDRHRSRWRRRR